MKRTIRTLGMMVLLMTAGSSMAFDPDNPLGFDVTNSYFSDPDFLNQTGEYDKDCDGNVYQWGTVPDEYLMQDRMNCRTGNGVHVCIHYVDGVGTRIDCPY